MAANHSPLRVSAVSAIGFAAVATMLVGCSHPSNGGHAVTGSKAAAVKTATVVAKADDIVNDPKARPSVSMKNCAVTGSGWTAGGTVTNSKASTARFTIVVSFTTKASTVLARGETELTLKAGQTRNWATTANFAKTKDVVCVLRGVSED